MELWQEKVKQANTWCYRLTHDISPEYCPDDNEDFNIHHPPFSPAYINNQSALTVRPTTGFQRGITPSTKDVNKRFFSSDIEDNNNEDNEYINREVCGRQPDIIETHVCRPNNKLLNSETNYYNYKNDQMVDFQNSNHVQEIIDTSGGSSRNSSPPPIRTRLGLNGFRNVRRPRKLPEIPKKYIKAPSPETQVCASETCNEKSLAEELEEAVQGSTETDEQTEGETGGPGEEEPEDAYHAHLQRASDHIPPLYKPIPRARVRRKTRKSRSHRNSESHLFCESNYTAASNYLGGANLHDTSYDSDCSLPREKTGVQSSGSSGRKDSGEDEGKNLSSCTSIHAVYLDLEVTHRGMHRFVPRHSDEMEIEIGDPIHVNKEDDDLWCEGVNLRSGKTGIFPSMYATNLDFLEEDEDEEDDLVKFTLRFLGSVEVRQHKGDDVLRQAISKVVLSRRETMKTNCPPMCTLEISDYGILMLDKSKEGHESDNLFTHFFSLKNISYCGHHPKNDRYFAFITKHPNAYKYACHVFLGERGTRSVSDAVGRAFKRFYQEYMAFTHPTEDIYME
ncbi:C-Jun-amino-terminal kinase-interacting protein 2-like [Liolophura sinensis]|uniref:C-Jun-amino-terminal kinase-interacting protein 2-like n=1 Tax=Liolophura sinensis TaxID=3198878 RepID=UPI0031594DFF